MSHKVPKFCHVEPFSSYSQYPEGVISPPSAARVNSIPGGGLEKPHRQFFFLISLPNGRWNFLTLPTYSLHILCQKIFRSGQVTKADHFSQPELCSRRRQPTAVIPTFGSYPTSITPWSAMDEQARRHHRVKEVCTCARADAPHIWLV